jgi:hypothetical protein
MRYGTRYALIPFSLFPNGQTASDFCRRSWLRKPAVTALIELHIFAV